MEKLTTIEGLAKAFAGLKGHFTKAAAHHGALAECHKAHGEFVKAKHEAMDDGDPHKDFFGKVAAHHTTKAALHKAHSEHLEEIASGLSEEKEGEKTAAVEASGAPESTGVEAMIKETTAGLVKKSLEMLNSDPEVAAEIRKMVLDGVKAALGDKIVPDHVRGVVPEHPGGLRLVPRAGAAPVDTGIENVDPTLTKLVG